MENITSNNRPTNDASQPKTSESSQLLNKPIGKWAALKHWFLSMLTKIGVFFHIVKPKPISTEPTQQNPQFQQTDEQNPGLQHEDEQHQDITTIDNSSEVQEMNTSTILLKNRLSISSLTKTVSMDHESARDHEAQLPNLVAQAQLICPKDLEQIKQQAHVLGLQTLVDCPLEQIDFSFQFDNLSQNNHILQQATKVLQSAFNGNPSLDEKQVLDATHLFVLFCQAANDAALCYTDIGSRSSAQMRAHNEARLSSEALANTFKPENINEIDLKNPQDITKLIISTMEHDIKQRQATIERLTVELDLAIAAYSRAKLRVFLEHLEQIETPDELEARFKQDPEFDTMRNALATYSEKLDFEYSRQQEESMGINLVLLSSEQDIESSNKQIKQFIELYKELDEIDSTTPLTTDQIVSYHNKIKSCYETSINNIKSTLQMHGPLSIVGAEFKEHLEGAISSILLVVDDQTIHELLEHAHEE